MRLNKGITVIISAVVIIAGLLGTLSVSRNLKNTREFIADGYILKPSENEVVTTDVDEQYYFSQGTKYKEKYATKILFKDNAGEEVSLDVNEFIHYADGSLGSFTKGVLMGLKDITEEQFGYYSLTKNTILIKNNNTYEMKSRGESMEISEFIWKISDTDYMIVSPEVTLHINDSTDITLPEYAQIKYVDNGIVRIVHQQGTYQTVSADTFLRTEGGAELNLVGKNFYVNGEPALSLDSMSIDDDSYIDLDENVDTPELRIPTFNVINGKDGTSGADGKSGEDGEEGVIGEDGKEGEEGVAGAEGLQGTEGGEGVNGVEGDTGIMGYDGDKGKDGKDAENAGQTGGVVAANLLARPTVTLNSANDYDVTASTANMQLKMDVSSGSLQQGTTTVTVYDRATMNPVYTLNSGATQNFESGAILDVNPTGLNPDTEYVLVVAGTYSPEEGTIVEGNLFTKIFKTDSLGIVLSKNSVTENSVSVSTKVTAGNVSSYDVIFFTEYENNAPKALVKYTKSSSEGELVMSDAEPSGSEREATFSMKSNTTYYACIANVSDTNGRVINTGDTTIELKTLKRKPYEEGDENKTISAMQPVITQNIRSHSLIVSMKNVIDPDNGVTGYRYELYKQADVAAAGMDGSYAQLKPVYQKESTKLENQTFDLSTTDQQEYCAKIVALFNDNEKDVEYATLFSTPSYFEADGDRFTVEFTDMNKGYTDSLTLGGPDKISGNIKITDPDGILISNINPSNPLVLTIAGDDISTYTQELSDLGSLQVGGYYLVPFTKNGLRKNATYTLTLHGPIDSDKNESLTDVEKLTYLAGIQGVTLDTKPLSLVSYDVNMPSVAFAKAFNLTSPKMSGATGEPVKEYYQYEAQILSNIKFKLIHIDKNGIERQIGNIATVTEKIDTNSAYNFNTSAWLERNASITEATDTGLTIPRTNANTNAEDAGFVLTPSSFGLDNSASVFFGGGQFKIEVESATDYTTKNVIPFTNDENKIVFEIVAKHVRATDPNTQVDAELILNKAAASGYDDSNVSEDTAVGIRFRAEYPYSDIKELTYYIYKLESTDPNTDVLDGTPGIGGAPGTPSTPINLNSAGIGATPLYGTLVLTGSRMGGASGGTSSTPVELYFKDTKSHVTTGTNYEWRLPDGTLVVDQSVLKRGERYFIRYEVIADHTVIDCKTDGKDDTYPFCAYDEGDTIPCYRSRILEIEKQTPKVERYPSDSGTGFAKWKYRIEDPDKAIVQDAEGEATFTIKQYANLGNAISGTSPNPSTTSVEVGTMTNTEFREVSFPLIDNRYYTISIPYRLSSVKEVENLVSIPVQFKNMKTLTPTDIKCQGLLATVNTPNENKVTIDEKEYEKALISESGYRYRLNFRGKDIPNYAGVRVTISGEGQCVVYDPVYFAYIGQTAGSDGNEPYAYAYLDTAPLKVFTDHNIATATVTVQGYYSTNQSGVDNYVSQVEDYTTTKDFSGENVFAMKTISSEGDVNYKKISSDNWTSTPQGIVGSIFVPGLEKGSGFKTPALESGSYVTSLMGRYPVNAMAVDASTMGEQSKKTVNLLFDHNGMKDTSSNYYMVEKLGLGNNIGFKDSSDTLQIADILPAVEENNFTIGARSARLRFHTLGTGATSESKIYAEVYMVEGNTPKLREVKKQTTMDVNGDSITYYEVGDTDAVEDYYLYDDFNGNAIEITSEGSNIIADLRLRELELGTKYQVKMFAYDNAHNKIYLYSRDKDMIGYPYEFTTKDSVDITIASPTYQYTSYNNKNANVRFGIGGDDEGTNMTIKWILYDISSAQIANGGAEKQSNGSYSYYMQNPADNIPISLNMSPPPGGILKLNADYRICLTAYSDEDNEVLGTKELSFHTPNSLSKPSFYVQTTQSAGKINASVVSTDRERSLKNDQFRLYLCLENGTVADTKTITRSGENQHTTVAEFSGITAGTTYILKLIADVDLDNNGTVESENQITHEYVITVSTQTKATLGGSADSTNLTLKFDNVQGFDDVRKIVVTAFNTSEQVTAYSTEIISGEPFVTQDGEGFEKVINWGAGTSKTSGWYRIQVQYRNEADDPLGNDEINIKCE